MKLRIFLLMLLAMTYLSADGTCVRIGEGTVAPLHEQKLQQHGVKTLGVIELQKEKQEAIVSKGLQWFESYEEAFAQKPHFWDICVPPEAHLAVMEKIIKMDPHACMIVEKPICMSYQIPELKQLLQNFQGKIVVNENYLSSEITDLVFKVAIEQLKLTPYRIVVEMDKNRIADVKRGRYVDPEGAFKYEGTHMVTILQSLLKSLGIQLPPKPTSVVYEDLPLNSPLKNQGSADIQFNKDGLEINLFSSMKGDIKNRYIPYARDLIKEEETALRYRVVAIEGKSPTGESVAVVGFYEPLINHPRSVGEVVVITEGKVEKIVAQVADDTMGKHLGLAADYLLGKTNINPCPPETGIEIVQILDEMLPKAESPGL